ncbi:uncharacterized protein LOC124368551 [Homalodisca vitripennis]|uniref:uncharacterized protein LOC124368551 n=1 Tax=Homalodisca vitripennis TaxID=197043 RepID=UPI001EEA21BE|nr:uncharacterized protein LOC124368551 [Homalodisca vitripennis]
MDIRIIWALCLTVTSVYGQCPIFCTDEYYPVCAYSYYYDEYSTFPNECSLDLENYCYGEDYELQYFGECEFYYY